MIDLGLEVAQRHPVLLEEAQQVLAGDAAVLRAGDAIAAQAAGIEPLAHRPGRDLADLRDLAGGEHFLHNRGLHSRVSVGRDLGGFLTPPVRTAAGS